MSCAVVRQHGSERGYAQHRYHRETPCDECRAAHAAYVAGYRSQHRRIVNGGWSRSSWEPARMARVAFLRAEGIIQ